MLLLHVAFLCFTTCLEAFNEYGLNTLPKSFNATGRAALLQQASRQNLALAVDAYTGLCSEDANALSKFSDPIGALLQNLSAPWDKSEPRQMPEAGALVVADAGATHRAPPSALCMPGGKVAANE